MSNTIQISETIDEIKEEWFVETTKVLEKYEFCTSSLIAILQETQRIVGYLPKPVLEYIATNLKIPASQVYSVATFYKAFKMFPSGKHIVKVCLGTACHIKGGPQLIQKLKSVLGVEQEKPTPDGIFSYETVRCVGCCGLAPVVMIDEDFHGKVTPKQIPKILKQYS